jgi:hypothetical protein
MAAAASMGFEFAALVGQQPFEFLRIHEYRLVNSSVEVNTSVDIIGPCKPGARLERKHAGGKMLAKRRELVGRSGRRTLQ